MNGIILINDACLKINQFPKIVPIQILHHVNVYCKIKKVRYWQPLWSVVRHEWGGGSLLHYCSMITMYAPCVCASIKWTIKNKKWGVISCPRLFLPSLHCCIYYVYFIFLVLFSLSILFLSIIYFPQAILNCYKNIPINWQK
jgi:hypothetical protein